MTEEWRDVPEYNGYYQVSNTGKVRSTSRWVKSGKGAYIRAGKLKATSNWGQGYPTLTLYLDGKQETVAVHSLVAAAFIGPRPVGMDVCHFDGNKENNSIENLRYDTRSANIVDEVFSGRHHMAGRTHCKNGHEFNETNTTMQKRPTRPNPHRRCKICKNLSAKIAYAKKRDGKLNPEERLALAQAKAQMLDSHSTITTEKEN